MTAVFFNDTATTEIYTLSLHDALPIWRAPTETSSSRRARSRTLSRAETRTRPPSTERSRSEEHTSEPSHSQISYAVFCLKKKNRIIKVRGKRFLNSFLLEQIKTVHMVV